MTDETYTSDHTQLKELLLSSAIQTDTPARLLIEKGVFSRDEYLEKMREVQHEYFDVDS